VWQLLHNESAARGEGYRLIIDLEENSYLVYREVLLDPGESVEVDYLKDLRTQGEQKRRADEDAEEFKSLEAEFEEEDLRQSGALEVLYYRQRFRDQNANIRVAPPLEFPSLAEPSSLSNGLEFRDVSLGGETISSGKATIRISSADAQFAVIHLQAEDQIFTIANNPATRAVRVHSGDLEFQWSLHNEKNSVQSPTPQ
jgi:hypothetical protein